MDPDYDEMIVPDFVASDDRPLWELAAAIRRGDRSEAELYLDRIAEELGFEAQEQVEQGRYSSRAAAL